MADPLVQTKLYLPRLRRSVVARPRLSGRLGRGSDARLTLISAPAGFGKTTPLTAWLADARRPAAALDPAPNETNRVPFWEASPTAAGGSALMEPGRTRPPRDRAPALLLLGSGAVAGPGGTAYPRPGRFGVASGPPSPCAGQGRRLAGGVTRTGTATTRNGRGRLRGRGRRPDRPQYRAERADRAVAGGSVTRNGEITSSSWP